MNGDDGPVWAECLRSMERQRQDDLEANLRLVEWQQSPEYLDELLRIIDPQLDAPINLEDGNE